MNSPKRCDPWSRPAMRWNSISSKKAKTIIKRSATWLTAR
ncbi:UNVERIFIED_CONTAM: hypothetical protein GTU68_001302 [Idotea baltica]|nr:hypothetical protein [Idotea baltica]